LDRRANPALVDLHLTIDTEYAHTIEIDLHLNPDTVAYLDCRRLAYEEIGGESFGVSRHRFRQGLTPETLDELRRLLPSSPLAAPANAPCGLDGTAFTLTIGRGADACEYVWRARPPAAWACVRDIVRLLVGSVSAAAGAEILADLDQALVGW